MNDQHFFEDWVFEKNMIRMSNYASQYFSLQQKRGREDESRNRAICSPCCVAGSKEALKIKNNPLTM